MWFKKQSHVLGRLLETVNFSFSVLIHEIISSILIPRTSTEAWVLYSLQMTKIMSKSCKIIFAIAEKGPNIREMCNETHESPQTTRDEYINKEI